MHDNSSHLSRCQSSCRTAIGTAPIADLPANKSVLLRAQLIDWDDGTTEHRRRKRNEVLAMTAVLIDTTFFQTTDALVQYMESLGKVECKTLCGMVRLSASGTVGKMRNRLVRAVQKNLGLLQLATVSKGSLSLRSHTSVCRELRCSAVNACSPHDRVNLRLAH